MVDVRCWREAQRGRFNDAASLLTRMGARPRALPVERPRFNDAASLLTRMVDDEIAEVVAGSQRFNDAASLLTRMGPSGSISKTRLHASMMPRRC